MGRVDCDLGFLALVAHTSIFLSYSLLRFGLVWFGLDCKWGKARYGLLLMQERWPGYLRNPLLRIDIL